MHESDAQRMRRLNALGRSLRLEKGGGHAGAHARDSRRPSVNDQPEASPDNLAANSDASPQQQLLNKLDAKMRKQKQEVQRESYTPVEVIDLPDSIIVKIGDLEGLDNMASQNMFSERIMSMGEEGNFRPPAKGKAAARNAERPRPEAFPISPNTLTEEAAEEHTGDSQGRPELQTQAK